MSKQRSLLTLTLAVLFSGGVFFCAFKFFSKPFDEDAVAFLELGMTLAEVQAIMGAPPGDYGHGEIGGWDFSGSIQFCCSPERSKNPTVKTWTGQRRVTCVEFDDAQRVRWIGNRGIIRFPDQTWIAKLRRFLRL